MTSETYVVKVRQAAYSGMSCPVCKFVMKPPIFLCKNGHSLCATCKGTLLIQACPVCMGDLQDSRNFSLEDVSNNMQLPCSNVYLGCQQFLFADEEEKHLKNCLYSTKSCFCTDCKFQGTKMAIINHCISDHNIAAWMTEENYIKIENMSFDYKYSDCQIVYAFQNHFVFRAYSEGLARRLHISVQFFGPEEECNKFFYKLKFSSGQRKIESCFETHPMNITIQQLAVEGKCFTLYGHIGEHFIVDGSLR